MKIQHILKNKQLILDGAMGTMLPRVSGQTEEEKVRKIHGMDGDGKAAGTLPRGCRL